MNCEQRLMQATLALAKAAKFIGQMAAGEVAAEDVAEMREYLERISAETRELQITDELARRIGAGGP